MSQKLPVNNFEWIKDTSSLNEDFIKICNKESDEGYLLEVGVQFPEKLHEHYNNLPFLPERMKLGNMEKLVANLHDKTENVIHIRNLKQALNHGLVLKKVHRLIKFNHKAWLKPYIDMNTELRQKTKNNFEKDFFKLMNNAVFGKTMENVRKHRNIKFVTSKEKKLFSIKTKLSYYKFFYRKFISNRNENDSDINE